MNKSYFSRLVEVCQTKLVFYDKRWFIQPIALDLYALD